MEPPPKSPNPAERTGRDAASGKFLKGNKGWGGGRPKNEDQIKVSERMWRIGEQVASEEVVRAMWMKAIEVALGGDGPMLRYMLDRWGGDTAPWSLVNEARELREMANRSDE